MLRKFHSICFNFGKQAKFENEAYITLEEIQTARFELASKMADDIIRGKEITQYNINFFRKK